MVGAWIALVPGDCVMAGVWWVHKRETVAVMMLLITVSLPVTMYVLFVLCRGMRKDTYDNNKTHMKTERRGGWGQDVDVLNPQNPLKPPARTTGKG